MIGHKTVVPIRPDHRISGQAQSLHRRMAQRNVPRYRSGEHNRCPGCDGRQFFVGRTTVECAHCGDVMVIVSDGRAQ